MEKLILHLVRDGVLALDFGDEITRGCVVTHEGRVVHPQFQDPVAAGRE